MGFTDFFTDVWETFSYPSPDAEVQGGSSTKSPASGTDEESGSEAEVNKQDQKKGGDSGEQGHKPSGKGSDEGDDDEEPEEDEEDEEEPDIKEVLEKGEYISDGQHSAFPGSQHLPTSFVMKLVDN
jgi:ubiquinol-cytochrome c reductase subunit 6